MTTDFEVAKGRVYFDELHANPPPELNALELKAPRDDSFLLVLRSDPSKWIRVWRALPNRFNGPAEGGFDYTRLASFSRVGSGSSVPILQIVERYYGVEIVSDETGMRVGTDPSEP